MRLRYLHLAHYPPLSDLRVAFASSTPWAAFAPEGESHRCAINFIIGLNGSGKSHLLRALAATFIALADERLPGFPVSLIYELGRPNDPDYRTLIFDCPAPHRAAEASLWIAEGWRFPRVTDRETFDLAIGALRLTNESVIHFGGAEFNARIARGDYPQAAPYALPRAVLAYTSGAMEPWRDAWQAPAEGEDIDLVLQNAEFDASQERPYGWTMEDEARILIDGSGFADERGRAPLPMEGVHEDLFRRPLLLEGVRLTAALLAVTLQDAVRIQVGDRGDERLATLFEKAGWHKLVGVRLRLNLDRALAAPRQIVRVLHDLLLAAGEAIREPHPTERWRSIYFDLDGALTREGSAFLDERISVLANQGQALHALLGEAGASAFERFGNLLLWAQHGLLDDIELLIRRVEKPEEASTTSSDDIGVLRLSELSDGERLVLSRWALFYLLADQDDALLLLDEPETHFNDAWKREIVDVIDGALGQDASTVLVATHSAIVLTDVFDEEIVCIRKSDGASEATDLTDRTFATDPSALMMTVFDTEDSIGTRALKRIEAFMDEVGSKSDPTPEDVRRLQALIERLGTGFYRSELQTLLNRWRQRPLLRAAEASPPSPQSRVLEEELRALIAHAQQGREPTEESDA